jgi:nucleotide-binding universal stress UspA family protein
MPQPGADPGAPEECKGGEMDRYRNILLYVDPAKGAEAAYAEALRFCRASGAKLRLLAVVPELSVYLRYPQFSYPSLAETLGAEAQGGVAELAARAREAGVDVSTNVRHGKPFLEITREAMAEGADLVMLTAEQDGALRRSTSTAMHLFRVCPRPVLAVRPDHPSPFGRILAAVDTSALEPLEKQLNEAILTEALTLAELDGARLDVLHAWSGESARSVAIHSLRDEIRAAAQASLMESIRPHGLPADHVHLVEGDPAEAITEFVERHAVDLLVMGTIVRTGVAGLLIGNTAENALSKAGCSVLALKPAGFQSPVAEDAPATER